MAERESRLVEALVKAGIDPTPLLQGGSGAGSGLGSTNAGDICRTPVRAVPTNAGRTVGQGSPPSPGRAAAHASLAMSPEVAALVEMLVNSPIMAHLKACSPSPFRYVSIPGKTTTARSDRYCLQAAAGRPCPRERAASEHLAGCGIRFSLCELKR